MATTIDDRRHLLTAGAARKPRTIATAAADHSRGNVIRLAIAQALAGANSTVIYATGAIVGDMLTPDKALATLPISILVEWPQARCRQGRLHGDTVAAPRS